MKGLVTEKRTTEVWDVECPKCYENNEYYPEHAYLVDRKLKMFCWNCPTQIEIVDGEEG